MGTTPGPCVNIRDTEQHLKQLSWWGTTAMHLTGVKPQMLPQCTRITAHS